MPKAPDPEHPFKETHSTISEYIGFVESKTDVLWYRGHGMDHYKLIPSLYRTRNSKTTAELYETEFQMISRFRQRSVPFVGDKFMKDDLATLFYMQHYGMPTRLLDWTENPYVALYFALNDPFNFDPTHGYKQDAVVWVLNPEVWNGKALDLDPPPGIISWPGAEMLNGYLPKNEQKSVANRNKDPVAVTGVHNNPRIVAQRGVFVLFGSDVSTMENIYVKNSYPEGCLVQIVIPKGQIESMKAALYRMGITDSVIYPDMQGLAAEIKRYFGY